MNYIEKSKDERHNIEFVYHFNCQTAYLLRASIEEAIRSYKDKIGAILEIDQSLNDFEQMNEFMFRIESLQLILKQLTHAITYTPRTTSVTA